VQWEADVRSVMPPDFMKPLRDTTQGWTEVILDEMERLPEELLRPFKDGAKPKGTIEIMMTLKSSPTEKFIAEIDRLRGTFNSFKL
jgi:hypothetical protein